MGMDSGAIVMLFWTTFAGWFIAETVIFQHGKSIDAPATQRDKGTIVSVLGSAALALPAAFVVAALVDATRFGGGLAFAVPGTVLAWAGIVLRVWAVRVLDQYFQPMVMIQDEHRLVTAGPYRLLRHPSYTGALLTLAGLGLILCNWMSLALMIIVPVLGYLPRIQVEEQALSEAFGEEYRRYQRDTHRLVPGVW